MTYKHFQPNTVSNYPCCFAVGAMSITARRHVWRWPWPRLRSAMNDSNRNTRKLPIHGENVQVVLITYRRGYL